MSRKIKLLKKIMAAAMIVMLLAPNSFADSWITIGTGDLGGGAGSFTLIDASPSSAYRGDNLDVTITGSGTNFTGSTAVDFGPDISVNSVIVNDSTHLTANISINTSAAPGPRNIAATTGPEIASGTVFTVNAPSISLSPSSGEQGWTGNIAVTGTGSHFINGTTAAVFSGVGITINSITVTSPVSATVNVTIDPAALMNSRTLTLSTDLGALGTETVTAAFAVTSGGSGVVIDDFEFYADKDHRGMMNYYYQSGSGVNEVTIPAPANSVTVVQEGIRSMEITYPGAAGTQWGGYWGGGLNSETKDLTPYNGISLWIKGDGTSNTISISLLEADVAGVPQETYASTAVTLTDTDWHEVEIPFSAFVRDPYGNLLEGTFSKVIKGYTVMYRGSQATSAQHRLDYIVAKNVSADTEPPTSVFGNSMVKNGSDLTLGWTPATDNIGVVGYYIYRSINPVFTPSLANRAGSSPVNSYTDAGVLSATDSYYYKVTAYDAAGNESVTASNMGYKLNKDMSYHSDGKSNINWISIPNITPYKRAADIAADIPNAAHVSRFNPATQTYQDYFKLESGSWVGNNFYVSTGESYAVVIEAASPARLVGWHIPYQINMLYNTDASNINWVSIPYNSVYAKASDLAPHIPNAAHISRFNPATQTYQDYFKLESGSWIGNNFTLIPGEGYAIVISDDSSWLPLVSE